MESENIIIIIIIIIIINPFSIFSHNVPIVYLTFRSLALPELNPSRWLTETAKSVWQHIVPLFLNKLLPAPPPHQQVEMFVWVEQFKIWHPY